MTIHQIDIDSNLLQEAIEFSNVEDVSDVVDAALRLFIQMQRQNEIGKLRDEITWEGELDAMREGQFVD